MSPRRGVARTRVPVLAAVALAATVGGTAEAAPVQAGPVQVRPPAPAPQPFSVMTFNLCLTEPWCTTASGVPVDTRKQRLFDLVRQARPDVLVTQEGAALRHERGLGSRSRHLTSRTVGTEYLVAFRPTATRAGLGIYVDPSHVEPYRDRDGRVVVHERRIGTDPQTAAPGAERRTARWAIFMALRDKGTGRVFWVGDAHLSDGNRREEVAARASQMDALEGFVRTELGSTPTILAGDFDESRGPTSDRVGAALGSARMLRDTQSSAETVAGEQLDSYQGGWSMRARSSSTRWGTHVDRVFASGDSFEVTRWSTAGPTATGARWSSVASDHIPVVTTLSLR